MDPTAALGDVPLFSGLRPSELRLIAGQLRRHRYRSETTVLHREHPGGALYVILSGKVKVHNESCDGKGFVLAVLAAGELFGEMSILDGAGRSANVTTLEPTEVLVLTRDDLMACIQQSPQIAINLLATLAGRLRLANENNQALATLDASGRAAKHLLDLGHKYGVRTATGVQIGIRLSQSDLAGLIGTTRETTNKILNEFRSLGWLSVDKQRHITLLREDRLIGRCGG